MTDPNDLIARARAELERSPNGAYDAHDRLLALAGYTGRLCDALEKLDPFSWGFTGGDAEREVTLLRARVEELETPPPESAELWQELLRLLDDHPSKADVLGTLHCLRARERESQWLERDGEVYTPAGVEALLTKLERERNEAREDAVRLHLLLNQTRAERDEAERQTTLERESADRVVAKAKRESATKPASSLLPRKQSRTA